MHNSASPTDENNMERKIFLKSAVKNSTREKFLKIKKPATAGL